MGVLVDTAVVPAAERFEYWRRSQPAVTGPVEVRRWLTRPFWGRICVHELGPIGVGWVAGDASSAVRRATLGEDGDVPLTLCVHLSGCCVIEQDGRTAMVGAGDLVTVDLARPSVYTALTPFELLAVRVPRRLLGPSRDHICSRTATRIAGDSGVAALVAPFLRQLVDGLDRGTVRDHGDLGEAVLSLVRAVLTQAPALDAASAGWLERIKASALDRLPDPALGPEPLARTHGISARYLHKLFAAEGMSVSRWIREQRLDRCRRDLWDPALGTEPIAIIAARWGFTNPQHFSRLFHAAYGVSPRAYRAAARRP